MNTVKFTATKLTATGKRGVLKADENGYYDLVIGGLNTFNSVGEYYTLTGAKDLFEQSNVFMRRVANGCLKGEVGHPKRSVGMTDDDYLRRILSIEETNVCCHFKEVWLDLDYGRQRPELQNPALVAIMGKVKPTGPKAEQLKQSLDNPDENVCFSIRALTKDYYQKGRTYRELNQICTFDAVTESGIATATKYNAPGLETLSELWVNQRQLTTLATAPEGIATESTRELAKAALEIYAKPTPPLYQTW